MIGFIMWKVPTLIFEEKSRTIFVPRYGNMRGIRYACETCKLIFRNCQWRNFPSCKE